MTRLAMLLLPFVMLTALSPFAGADETWTPLFNGRDLDDWTPKITGYALGENYAETFRVEEGLLKVRYDQYAKDAAGKPLFKDQFGHLFYTGALGRKGEGDAKLFSHYKLRVEYRFVGEQTADGPEWATRNSGVMLHGQTPDSMAVEQLFPDSLEAQFLGGLAPGPRAGKRPTANLCTPGTEVAIDGRRVESHCVDSSSETFDGDQWVTAEFEVSGGDVIRHSVAGEVVLEYRDFTRDGRDGAPSAPLAEGTISLQSESHPIDFRRVEFQALVP
ncbi:MAG: 3-keto-disaccharide hydrolase [Lacipirellulaceae bacterium]